MRILSATAAAVLLALPGVASAAQVPCLTPAEFAAVSTFALPGMIRGATQRCAAQLPADAFLRREGGSLAARYGADSDRAWSGARSAFLKIAAGSNPDAAQLFTNLPDTTLRPLADQMLQGLVEQRLPTDRCKPVNRMLMLLSPLPAASTAELIGLAAGLGGQGGAVKIGKLGVCAA